MIREDRLTAERRRIAREVLASLPGGGLTLGDLATILGCSARTAADVIRPDRAKGRIVSVRAGKVLHLSWAGS